MPVFKKRECLRPKRHGTTSNLFKIRKEPIEKQGTVQTSKKKGSDHLIGPFASNNSRSRFDYFETFPQSFMKISSPLSVSGSRDSSRITANGRVATSAPRSDASSTCMGWRTLATRTWERKS